ncbi:Flagellar motor switch protein FliN [Liberibacter crescens BT-1]|uniref:Flagellar motor switch protein FliN n=1 Tax=Liberibacter crescens (strain BT-1) TaxID=1215343 RepID=L0EUW5_LIBCB|nr:flagellar motor switch protein FliN [Liberibacter crescens]AGA64176.1 Flagellar motor switch protein FliN [Liberibacter crescens BT-1]
MVINKTPHNSLDENPTNSEKDLNDMRTPLEQQEKIDTNMPSLELSAEHKLKEFNAQNNKDFNKDSSPVPETPLPLNSLSNSNLEMIMDIPINMQIILGSCRMQISSLMNLSEGAIITLDKRIDEPVDIAVNDRKIAKGEITILENNDAHFGIKLIEILNSN